MLQPLCSCMVSKGGITAMKTDRRGNYLPRKKQVLQYLQFMVCSPAYLMSQDSPICSHPSTFQPSIPFLSGLSVALYISTLQILVLCYLLVQNTWNRIVNLCGCRFPYPPVHAFPPCSRVLLYTDIQQNISYIFSSLTILHSFWFSLPHPLLHSFRHPYLSGVISKLGALSLMLLLVSSFAIILFSLTPSSLFLLSAPLPSDSFHHPPVCVISLSFLVISTIPITPSLPQTPFSISSCLQDATHLMFVCFDLKYRSKSWFSLNCTYWICYKQILPWNKSLWHSFIDQWTIK